MEFVRQRTLQAVDLIVGFVVSIALAAAGTGYWALAGGILAGAWAAAIAALWSAPIRPRSAMTAGRCAPTPAWPLFAAGAGDGDRAELRAGDRGGQLGLAAVGALTLAATISQFTDRVDGVITGSLYPAICAVRDRLDLLLESFVKSNRIALMWAVPFGFALSLFAADLVHFGLGDEWDRDRAAADLRRDRSARAHRLQLGRLLRARGTTRPMAIAATAAAVAFLISLFPLVAAFGLTGLAVATGIQGAVHAHVPGDLPRATVRRLRLRPPRALREALPTLPAVGAVLLLRAFEPGDCTAGLAVGELGLYAALIIVATLAFEGALVREAVGYLRSRPSSARSVAPTAAGSSVT